MTVVRVFPQKPPKRQVRKKAEEKPAPARTTRVSSKVGRKKAIEEEAVSRHKGRVTAKSKQKVAEKPPTKARKRHVAV